MFELPLYPTSQSSGSQQYISLTPITISPFSRWDEITNEKVKPSDRPVVLNRASSTNTTNPFGSTFCYGYQVCMILFRDGNANIVGNIIRRNYIIACHYFAYLT